MIPCRTIDSSAHHSSGWFFFVRPSRDVHLKRYFVKRCSVKLTSSSSSLYTVTTGGFEGITTSSAMSKLSLASTKTEGSRNNVVLAFKRGRGMFI